MTLLMIVVTEVTKKRIIARESIASVPNPNFVAATVNAFRVAGCVVRVFPPTIKLKFRKIVVSLR